MGEREACLIRKICDLLGLAPGDFVEARACISDTTEWPESDL